MRVLPNPVRSFARALAVQFGQIFPSRRLNPGGFRQLHQKLFIPLLAVPAHDAAQRCIRFQRSGIDADRLPRSIAPIRFSTQSKTASWVATTVAGFDRGVIRRRLAHFQSQKLSQSQRIAGSPGNLLVDPQQPYSRCATRSSCLHPGPSTKSSAASPASSGLLAGSPLPWGQSSVAVWTFTTGSPASLPSPRSLT